MCSYPKRQTNAYSAKANKIASNESTMVNNVFRDNRTFISAPFYSLGHLTASYTSPLQNRFHAVNYTIKCDRLVNSENGQDTDTTYCSTATMGTPSAVSRFAAAPPSVIVLQAGRNVSNNTINANNRKSISILSWLSIDRLSWPDTNWRIYRQAFPRLVTRDSENHADDQCCHIKKSFHQQPFDLL